MKLFSLIKSGNVHLSKQEKIIPKKEYQTLVDAKEIVSLSKEESTQLLQETKQECEELKKQAYETGLQEGLTQFNQQLVYMNEELKKLSLETMKQVLPLALKAAKKIVGEELKVNPDTIVSIVQQAIKPVVQSHNIKILVNKSDIKHLQEKKEQLKTLFERLEHFSIEERSDIDSGSCIIETEVGIINATLDNQWRALEAAFEKFTKKK